jgi:hypothetical protein
MLNSIENGMRCPLMRKKPSASMTYIVIPHSPLFTDDTTREEISERTQICKDNRHGSRR